MASEMFRAPLHRGMRTLDRSAFAKTVSLKAARIFDNKNISRIRSALERSKDALQQDRVASVHPDPDPELATAGKKCLLLRPEAVASGIAVQSKGDGSNGGSTAWPHSATVSELVKEQLIAVVPLALALDYNYWTYHDIISAILPEDAQGEIPSGFSQVGHVAHLNLRDEYLKYKGLIAEILIDKNPGVRTVINKIDDVGEENQFRTFRYEVLAGPDDLKVEVSEENCIFRFDYSKVYWNTRLNTEHRRLVDLFKQGEAVCDVMAGIGPFAVPAGKKEVFVWANDLNPDSYSSLTDAVARNKVGRHVRPFNEDGRSFIRTATAQLALADHSVDILSKTPKKDPGTRPALVRTQKQPNTFQHFVLNLPASALTFLPSFVGLYPDSLREHLPVDFPMPLVHVYCFSTKSDDNKAEGLMICEEIGRHLGYAGMEPGRVGTADGQDGDGKGAVEIWDVRDVAPKKRMFCATFRLPREVAFREV
ncbi:tRNA(m(1)G37)methyltransferase [Teratosphaeriaceae sp. CCFEE 6253]|nr:tRNA(m(1)G37)methyltransferase [Teratosphaeriaceae sp. CCFEE 6253]